MEFLLHNNFADFLKALNEHQMFLPFRIQRETRVAAWRLPDCFNRVPYQQAIDTTRVNSKAFFN
ncbi:MAG: hypothetical protein C5B47_04745 [Verrucomicrobia bacterium]|nr:MAG: hypothetical protein C5B47_04745 [Verrucomicrobiota bacterium]